MMNVLSVIRMREKIKNEFKDTELRVLIELLKNSRRSDREIAHILGVSQPTVSRTIKKLEKEGAIKEYTIIPDFRMLGYNILGTSRLQVSEESKEGLQQVRKSSLQMEKDNPNAFLLAVNGMAGKTNRLFMVLYKTYSDYVEVIRLIKNAPFVEVESVDTFLADLNDETNLRVLSMSGLANHLLQSLEKKSKPD